MILLVNELGSKGHYIAPQSENGDLKKAPPRSPPLAFRVPLKIENFRWHIEKENIQRPY